MHTLLRARTSSTAITTHLRADADHREPCVKGQQWYIHVKMILNSIRLPNPTLARMCGLLPLLSGCSLILDLEERTCESDEQCDLGGGGVCVQGICELANDEAGTTGTGTTTSPGVSSSTDGAASDTSMSSWTSTEDGSTTSAQLSTTGDANTSAGASSEDDSMGSTSDDGETTTGCADEGCTTTMGSDTDTASESSESGDPPPPPVELITNHGFESSDLGWSRFGAPEDPVTFVRSTEDAYMGSACGLASSRAAHWQGVSANVTARVRKEVSYSVSAWLKLADDTLPEGRVMQLSRKLDCVELAQPSYGALGSTAIGVVTPDEWIQLSGTMLIPEDCTVREVLIYFEEPSSSTEPFPDFYIDEVYATPATL